MEIHNYSVFADGGTICVYSQVSDSLEVRISLPPNNCLTHPGTAELMHMALLRSSAEDSDIYEVAGRSELEQQVMALLRGATFRFQYTLTDLKTRVQNVSELTTTDIAKVTNELVRFRDKIVSVVESDRYLRRGQNDYS